MENTISSFQELSKLSNNVPYYFSGNRSYSTGWKMHLFLNSAPDKFPDLHNETVQNLSKFLMDGKLEHKFKNGCDGANTFCIYIGDRDDCERLAKELISKFGKEFSTLSPKGNAFSGSDQNLLQNPNIGIRFDGVNENQQDSPFGRYGSRGIPTFIRSEYLANSVLGREISSEQEDKLKKVASHLILSKYCGDKYLGKNYHKAPWDKELFETVSEFSAEEINKYTKTCIAMFNPQKYIKPTSLALDGEGCDIDISTKMKSNSTNRKALNKVSIKDHGFSIQKADNVCLYEKKDKSGEELVWNQGERQLAKCTMMKEGHSFVSLSDDKSHKTNFMVYKGSVYEIVNGKAECLEKASLSARIENIVSESTTIRKRMIDFSVEKQSFAFSK